MSGGAEKTKKNRESRGKREREKREKWVGIIRKKGEKRVGVGFLALWGFPLARIASPVFFLLLGLFF